MFSFLVAQSERGHVDNAADAVSSLKPQWANQKPGAFLNTSAYMHVVETSLDLLEFARVRDIFINFDFSSKIIYRSFSHTILGTGDEGADRQRELEVQIFLWHHQRLFRAMYGQSQVGS